MFNLIRDDFEESLEDIMNSIDKILDEESTKNISKKDNGEE